MNFDFINSKSCFAIKLFKIEEVYLEFSKLIALHFVKDLKFSCILSNLFF